MLPDDVRASFEDFVAARRQPLLVTAFLLTANGHDAEDLVQAALIKALPRWAAIHAQPEAYVRKIMAREAVSRWRTRRWRETATATLPEALADGADHDRRLTVVAALRSLPPRQRTVVVLRYYEDLTEKQTAAILGITLGTVKSHHRDAILALRTRLPELAEVFA